MDAKLEKILLASGPNLCRNLDGIECGDGWFPLLLDLIGKLEAICSQQEARGKENQMVARQIKEKLGGLRFYVSNAPQEAADLVQEAEQRSTTTCDRCGGPGRIRSLEGWLTCLCDAHVEEAERERR